MKKFFIVLLVLACIAAGIYFAVTQNKADEATSPAPHTTDVVTVPTQAPTAKATATVAPTKVTSTAAPTKATTATAAPTKATTATATLTPEPTPEPTPEMVTTPVLLGVDTSTGVQYWQFPDGTILNVGPTQEPTPEPTPTPEPQRVYPYFFVKDGENWVIPLEGAPEMKAQEYLTMLYGASQNNSSSSANQGQATATPKPTATPSPKATTKPTATPTPAPTAKPANNKLTIMQKETRKATVGSYALVSYTVGKTRDYKASLGTNISDLYGREMFDVLAPEFVKFAGNFAMQFDGVGTPEERFQQAINSAVGESGRLILRDYSGTQSAQMERLLATVTDYEAVTKTMVLWLVEYTAINPSNSAERVFLVQ